ncbi:MAG: SusC/RagA family TonB-linked outer membrane protein [Cytophagales bacterium]|nr:MAG: SusC/RagA family TonB-linked outer membrane protein [Cytophagales bacterium]
MKHFLFLRSTGWLLALLGLVALPDPAVADDTTRNPEKVAQVANRRVTLSATNRELKAVLDDLSKQANVRFSYSSAVVPVSQHVTISATDRPLEQVLTNLLTPLQIQFEITRKQVILSRKNVSLETLTPKAITPAVAPQDRTITRQITDEAGQGLPGATIIIKQRSTIGTSADANGRFTLKIPDGDQTLVVSSIGYVSQEVAVGNRSVVNVAMKESDRSLNEVVVVGYGTQTRRNVTTAISQVKGAELREINAPGLDQALQGRAAGVQVTKNTGAPGGGVSIRVRGTASILGGQEPLYIVDGIPINNTPTGSTDVFSANRNGGVAGNESINPISQIPVDDIETIEILKDAASASIYGARAANGVVIITTKRGKAGKVETSLSGYTGFGEVPQNRRYQLLNGPEFAEAVNLSRRLRKLPIVYRDSINVPSTDWQDEIFQRAPINSLNANVSGGTEKVRFSFSAGYFNQQGTIIGTKFNRINLRNSFDFNLSKKVRAGMNLMLNTLAH